MFVHILTSIHPANVREVITRTTIMLVALCGFSAHGPLVSASFLSKDNFLYGFCMFSRKLSEKICVLEV